MQEDLTLNVGTKGAEEASNKIRGVKENLADTAKETSNFGDKLQKASLALTAVGVGLTAYSKSATDSAVNYVKSVNSIARVTGDSVEQTSRLQYVFQRSGIAADQAATVFARFSKQIVASNEAIKDGGAKQAELNNKIEAARIKISELTAEQVKNGDSSGKIRNQIEALNLTIQGYQKTLTDTTTPLQKLGVATQDASGRTRSFNDILLDVADKFSTMPNGAEKTAAAIDLFGKQGAKLLPVLNKGRQGIEELQDRADKLGITLTTTNVEAVSKYVEANKRLQDSQQQLTLAVGRQALPMWQKLADVQLQLIDIYQGLPAGIKDTVTAVLAFGGPVATAAGSVSGLVANLVTAKPAVDGLSKAMGGLTKGFGWIAVIGIAVAALIYLEEKTKVFTKTFQTIQTALQPVVDWFMVNLYPVLSQIASFIGGQFKQAWNDLKISFMQVSDALAPLIPKGDQLKLIIIALAAPAIVAIAIFTAFAVAIGAIAAAIARVAAWFTQMQVWFYQAAATAGQAVGQIIGWFGRLPDAIGQKINEVVNWIRGLPGRMLGALGDLGGLLYNAGKSVLDGFINGITSKINDVRRTLTDLTSKLTSWKGPASTDKVILQKNGQYVIGGFINGLESMYGKVRQSLGGLTNQLSVNPTISGSMGSQGVARGYSSSPSLGSVNADSPIAPTVKVEININGNMIGGDQASMRSLGVQLAQLTQDALKSQGVNNVNQLRTA